MYSAARISVLAKKHGDLLRSEAAHRAEAIVIATVIVYGFFLEMESAGGTEAAKAMLAHVENLLASEFIKDVRQHK